MQVRTLESGVFGNLHMKYAPTYLLRTYLTYATYLKPKGSTKKSRPIYSIKPQPTNPPKAGPPTTHVWCARTGGATFHPLVWSGRRH